MFTVLLSANNLFAQNIIQRDPQIEEMAKEVSADSLQSYIKSMVAFGTRNTLRPKPTPSVVSGLHVIGYCQSLMNLQNGQMTDYRQ